MQGISANRMVVSLVESGPKSNRALLVDVIAAEFHNKTHRLSLELQARCILTNFLNKALIIHVVHFVNMKFIPRAIHFYVLQE